MPTSTTRAAIPTTAPNHSRLRSQSDPFSDPDYTVPPAPPPKSGSTPTKTVHRSHQSQNTPQRSRTRDPVMEAVKDTVVYRSNDQHRSRPSTGRTQTNVNYPSTAPVRPTVTNARRSHSDDSVRQAAAVEKAKATGRKPGKKGSSHADVIDRLDFTGVGPMFHHDGPFDACAPSRNRQRTKAPMYSWTGVNPEDAQVAAKYRDIQQGGLDHPSLEGPYAAASKAPASPYYPEPPKKQVDAIAEAWGMHEPEPYEEFFAGGDARTREEEMTAYESKGGHGRERRPDPGARRPTKRGAIPPPQPIFVEPELRGLEGDGVPPSPPLSGSPGVRRNKSLMHRIRKMRDAPNVPVGYDDGAIANGEGSPTSSSEGHAVTSSGRPTHRTQNSILGRFGRHSRDDNLSPASDRSEQFIYVEDPKDKELPATPYGQGQSRQPGYFDDYPVSAPAVSPGDANGGLGRKTSLMKRVKGVVRGAK